MASPENIAALRRALIVHAHPEPASFSSSQAAAFAEQLRAEGMEVDFVDLYADRYDPLLAREQFMTEPGHFKPQAEQMRAVENGTLHEPIVAHLEKLLEADLLVLSFPVWWFSMPAILKGWIDQTFLLGSVFGGEYGIHGEGGMVGKKAMLLLTTGGKAGDFVADNYGDRDQFFYHIHHGMLKFVGYDVLPPFITHAPVRLSDEDRDAALRKVRAFASAQASVAIVAAA